MACVVSGKADGVEFFFVGRVVVGEKEIVGLRNLQQSGTIPSSWQAEPSNSASATACREIFRSERERSTGVHRVTKVVEAFQGFKREQMYVCNYRTPHEQLLPLSML